MDANGLRFWLLADQIDWDLAAATEVSYDDDRKSLRLADRRDAAGSQPAGPGDFDAALALVPASVDEFGTWAYWSADLQEVVAGGALPGAVPLYQPAAEVPPAPAPTDLAPGNDGVLYMAAGGHVRLHDLRGRWQPVIVARAGFNAWRLAAAPEGGVWALDPDPAPGADGKRRPLARLLGLPCPDRPPVPYLASTWRPCEENADPPRLALAEDAVLPDGEAARAIACSPGGRVALLATTADGKSLIYLLASDGTLWPAMQLDGAGRPFSLAWADEKRLAVLPLDLPEKGREALVYEAPDEPESGGRPATVLARPVGDIYPLSDDYQPGPFLHSLSLPPQYPLTPAEGRPGSPPVVQSAPLYHLSLPTYPALGQVVSCRPMDSGSSQTEWHRLYLEAVIPPHCGVVAYLAATDDPDSAVAAEEWHEHRFGERYATSSDRRTPRGAWLRMPSEVPFHEGWLPCPLEPERAGLFTVLIQRPQRRVRTLRGRYLRVKLVFEGDGRATPELFSVRAYASRFSYLNHYLPELYRETEFGIDADAVLPPDGGTSTRADFLERFLDLFEGVLTPVEDRIANAHLLTQAETTPEEALEWLASWVGLSFDPAYPPERRRELLRAAPTLFRLRGVYNGLRLALDVATGGACATGEIVILEDWRLRRTFATILGAYLIDEDDPVLAGFSASGNSFVGDTLILGDEERKEFLAMFSADLKVSRQEQQAIDLLFERLAFRITVLVHREVHPQDLGLIRRVVDLETPAHIQARVLTASEGFLVGAASLVGADTFLGLKPKPGPVRVNASAIGLRDLIRHTPYLDPRTEGGISAFAPVADAGPDLVVEQGLPFAMDASKSKSGSGGPVVRFVWKRVE